MDTSVTTNRSTVKCLIIATATAAGLTLEATLDVVVIDPIEHAAAHMAATECAAPGATTTEEGGTDPPAP